MTELVAVDIGGTHARFALAEVSGGRVAALHPAVTLKTADHAGLPDAWRAFAATLGRPLPRAAAIAFAGPMAGEVVTLTNHGWTLHRARIGDELGIDDALLLNDFGAVGHAVAQVAPADLRPLCGPDEPLHERGLITIVGPGTGLGAAHVRRDDAAHYRVTETEGGHIGYAPLDSFDDRLVAALRERHGRISAERIVSGAGLARLHAALAQRAGATVPPRDDAALWAAALAGTDRLAAAALARFCLSLGAVAGDLALAQGADAVVIAGGLGLRLADRLPGSSFARGFTAKGRFAAKLAAIPVRLLVHPQPGLFGAAAAFAQRASEVG